MNLDGSPIYTRVQRLTNSQWENSVRDILRIAPDTRLSENFSFVLPRREYFTNNEKHLVVGTKEALDFESGSEAAAALAAGTADALDALDAGSDMESFVRRLGRRAFRRPLTSDEETKYQGVFALGESLYGVGFANGAALVIRAMLQSPHFLYRVELGPGGEPLSGFEVASKLSFWLLDTTPSDALLDDAEAGVLDSVEGLEAAAREMLETPAAAAVMRDFHGQLHGFSAFANVEKPGVAGYTPELNPELAEASFRFFDRVFTEGEGVVDIFTSTRGIVGPELAPLYGVEPPSSWFEEYDLGPTRLGYFMQVPFLLRYGSLADPDPIHRGFALHFDVLCATLPPPPDDVPQIPQLEPGQTNRERFEAFTAGCGDACHGMSDELGFAFEGFDGLGRHREEDNGRPVDASGSYPFAEGTREFTDAKELMQILAGSLQAHTCYAKKLTGYALQRDIVEDDRPLLEDLAELSRSASMKDLVLSVVRNPAFRVRQESR